MAQQQDNYLKSFTIAFHGNNDFSSKKMQELLGHGPTQYSKYIFHFLYTEDLNLFHQYDNLDFDNSLTKLEESRFVILIGLEVIFSSSMLSLIYSIPGRYGLDPSRENFFWHKAVVVFYVGGHQDHDQVIQQTIDNNSGIREVVERVGGRYTYVPQFTRQQFLLRFTEILEKTDIPLPSPSPPPNPRHTRDTFLFKLLIGLLVSTSAALSFIERKPALPINKQNKLIEFLPMNPLTSLLSSILQSIAISAVSVTLITSLSIIGIAFMTT